MERSDNLPGKWQGWDLISSSQAPEPVLLTTHYSASLRERLVGNLFSTEREIGGFRDATLFQSRLLPYPPGPCPVLQPPLPGLYYSSHAKVLTLLTGSTVQLHTYKFIHFFVHALPISASIWLYSSLVVLLRYQRNLPPLQNSLPLPPYVCFCLSPYYLLTSLDVLYFRFSAEIRSSVSSFSLFSWCLA